MSRIKCCNVLCARRISIYGIYVLVLSQCYVHMHRWVYFFFTVTILFVCSFGIAMTQILLAGETCVGWHHFLF